MPDPGTLAVDLGRAFADTHFPTEPVDITTPYGPVTLHRLFDQWLLFRHGKAQATGKRLERFGRET